MPLLLPPLSAVTDASGAKVIGALVQVYLAGTTTPAPIYLDAGFANPATNPVLTQGGDVPPIYVPSGSYRVRVVDRGTVLKDYDDLVIAAGGSSGGGDPGDPNAVFSTGDIKHRYDTGQIAGWVRCNGRMIGSAGSGAPERANDDCFALFVHLWNIDPNLEVSGGRGASANADWTANKRIATPDGRSRALVGLDSMGNAAAGRLAGIAFGSGGPSALGSYGGAATFTLAISHLPAHAHAITVTTNPAGGHAHGGTTDPVGAHAHGGTTDANDNKSRHQHDFTTDPVGPHNHNYVTAALKNIQAGSGSQISGLWAGGNDQVGSGDGGPHAHGGTTNANDNKSRHQHDFTTNPAGGHAHGFTTNPTAAHVHPVTASATDTGGGNAFSVMGPFMLVTTYIKL